MAATMGLTGAAGAAVINWTLSNGTFDDGGTFSGTFSVDTVTDWITAWNITTTAGTSATTVFTTGVAYPGGSGFDLAFDTFPGATFVSGFVPVSAGFNLTNLLISSPGTVDHLAGYEAISGFTPFGFIPLGSRDITDGQAVGVLAAAPEPASWTLMIVGVGLAGASLRRRRAAIATA